MTPYLESVRFVLFDAVGTLIHPQPGAAEAYFQVGERLGVCLPRDEIARRFPAALKKNTQDGDVPTNEDRERDRWRRIVADVFRASEAKNEALFHELWSEFGDYRKWAVYEDAASAWRAIEAIGLKVGVASNFDARLMGILRALGGFGDEGRWFYSSLVGFSKPNRQFFTAIADRLKASPQELLLVGDDLGNDYLAAREAGWRSLWLDRYGAAGDNAANGERIASLGELAKLFRPQ